MDARRDDAVSTLIDLIACCRDGEQAYRACARQVRSESLRQMLLHHAAECQSAVAELSHWVVRFTGPSAVQ